MTKDKINIAIAGYGNIGSYFYKILEKNKKTISLKTGKTPVVKYISSRNIKKKRKIKLPKSKWIKNPMFLPNMNDVDVIIELIGGSGGIAKKLVFAALKSKKHVITANKSLMAKHGDELALIAELRSGRINAALDVFDNEPLPGDNPFRDLSKENVLLTPHMAAHTVEARRRQGTHMVAEIQRYLAGESLLYEVKQENLVTMA